MNIKRSELIHKNVWLPRDLYVRLMTLSHKRNESANLLCQKAIDQYLKQARQRRQLEE